MWIEIYNLMKTRKGKAKEVEAVINTRKKQNPTQRCGKYWKSPNHLGHLDIPSHNKNEGPGSGVCGRPPPPETNGLNGIPLGRSLQIAPKEFQRFPTSSNNHQKTLTGALLRRKSNRNQCLNLIWKKKNMTNQCLVQYISACVCAQHTCNVNMYMYIYIYRYIYI